MRAKVLLGAAGAAALVVGGVALVVHTVFTSAEMRERLATQLSALAGRPVRTAALSAGLWPRPYVTLHDVGIDTAPPVQIAAIELRPRWSALLTRRLDVGALDGIGISDAEVRTRGRRVRAGGRFALRDDGVVVVREAVIASDEMKMTIDGSVTYRPGASDGQPLAGQLTIRANAIDADVLLAAAAELIAGGQPRDAAEPAPAPDAPPSAEPGGLRLDIESGRLALGPLSLTDLRAQAALGPGGLRLDPISLSGFGGTYKGQIDVRLDGAQPAVRWYGDLAGIDLGKALESLGTSDALSGVLSGDVDLTGTGTDFATALKSARGSARVTLSNGVVRRLGIARTILTASSSRPQETAQNPPGSADTAFTSLASVLTISGGSASVVELQAESPEVTVRGGGGLRLDGSNLTMFVAVRLSPELSQQIAAARGRALPAGARLEVPATIRGNTTRYSMELDLSELTVIH